MKTTLALQIKPSKRSWHTSAWLVQGHDKRAHQCYWGILSSIGPLNHPHHHLWPSAWQTTKQVQDHQRHHLGQSQNPPLHWANVQEWLLHQRPNDQVQNEGWHQQDLAPYPTFLHQFFAQRKTYGDNCAPNSGFVSAAHINDIPTNCSLVSTSSDFTTRDLYIESLKESLAAAREYVAKECAPTPDKPDQANLLRIELDA